MNNVTAKDDPAGNRIWTGVCQICGCTDEKACLHTNGIPCSWIDASHTTCSACAVKLGSLVGARLIMEERGRQIAKNGWDAEHDDKAHSTCTLVNVACDIARGVDDEWGIVEAIIGKEHLTTYQIRLKRFAVAGALIAAAMDRELRESGMKAAGSWTEEEPLTLRNDQGAYEFLGLVMESPPSVEVIATWRDDQIEEALAWAAAEHLYASDNEDVERLPRPSFLPPDTRV